jgi:hypothetical protein
MPLALLLLGQEVTGVVVSAQTKDGQTLAGVTQTLTIDFQSSLGKSTVKLEDLTSIGIGEKEQQISTNDGTTLKGKLITESIKIKTKLGEMTIKFADLVALNITGVQRGQPRLDENPNPANPPKPGPVQPTDVKKPEPKGLKPLTTLKIGALVTRVLASADGKKLYVLNGSDSKLLIVDAAALTTDKEIALGGETAIALGPTGKVMLACGKKTVTAISLEEGKVTKTFPIENDTYDLVAIDDQTALLTTSGGVVTVSVPKQSIVSKLQQGGQGNERMHLLRDAKKIYTSGGAILLPDKAKGRDELVWSPYAGGQGTGYCTLSPDGRFAVAASGIVFRTGKSFVADMVQLTKVEPHWTSAFDTARKRVLVFQANGFVKEYDTETFEIARTFQLGYKVLEARVDADGATFTVFGTPANAGEGGQRPYNQATLVGDLMKFEMPK